MYAASKDGNIEHSPFYAVGKRLWFEDPRVYTVLVEDVSRSPDVDKYVMKAPDEFRVLSSFIISAGKESGPTGFQSGIPKITLSCHPWLAHPKAKASTADVAVGR